MWPFYACTVVIHRLPPPEDLISFYVYCEQWIVLSYRFVKNPVFCFVLFPHVDKFSCNTVSPHELCNKITSGKKKRTPSVFFFVFHHNSALPIVKRVFGCCIFYFFCVKRFGSLSDTLWQSRLTPAPRLIKKN